jgi:hypothetical protein
MGLVDLVHIGRRDLGESAISVSALSRAHSAVRDRDFLFMNSNPPYGRRGFFSSKIC